MTPGRTLTDLADHYKVDGDYMRCMTCNRPQQVMWCHSAFPHAADCRIADKAPCKPWIVMLDAVNAAHSAQAPR